MSHAQQPMWRWDPDSQQQYYYEQHTDCLVFQNGVRKRRPPHISQAALLATPPPIPGPRYGDERQQITDSLASVSLQQRDQPESSRTSNFNQTRDQPRAVRFEDDRSKVKTSYQSGPADRITAPDLFSVDVRATRLLFAPDGGSGPADEELFEGYRRRAAPQKFFTIGKVFLVLWAEPAGENATQLTAYEPGLTIGLHGQKVFSKVRRFVVIRPSERYCTCLPITTYGRQGVAKRNVKKSEHSIIYTGKAPPEASGSERPARGEQGMRPQPVRVDVDDPTYKLDKMSRLDYGGVHTIQHNIKVKSFGKVNPNSMNALLHQFGNVWTGFPTLPPAVTADSDVEGPSARPARSARSGESVGSDFAAPSSKALGKRRESQSVQFSSTESARGRRDTVTSTGDRRSGNREVSQGDTVKAYVQTLIRKYMANGYSAEEARDLATQKVFPDAMHQATDDQQDDDEAGDEDADAGDEGRNAPDDASDDGEEDEDEDEDDEEDDEEGAEDEEEVDEPSPQRPGGRYTGQTGSSVAPRTAPSIDASSSNSAKSQFQAQFVVLMQRYMAQGRTREQATELAKNAIQARKRS